MHPFFSVVVGCGLSVSFFLVVWLVVMMCASGCGKREHVGVHVATPF